MLGLELLADQSFSKRAITVSDYFHVKFKKGVFGFKRVNHKMIFKRAITVKELIPITFKKGVLGLKSLKIYCS